MEIIQLYHNSVGTTYQWKSNDAIDIKKIQLIFRDTGLLITHKELTVFFKLICTTTDNTKLCKKCSEDNACKAIHLKTPIPQVSFAVSAKELKGLSELVEGTIFQLGLNKLLHKL
ncbi:hypothetical protein LV716_11190 [Flagellimonas sp. HMM57]|uniref:hypothetical protein n=1 Tax=unclassified Flagellimonas TaxID=2644544 RepID=UPI0013D01E98|nr:MULTISPECIES: hypothetical protein [unclassified Flagellimonas]UII74829.1 hypothetical protein LV716_11190 [Flagellimonas sp. HMM57]